MRCNAVRSKQQLYLVSVHLSMTVLCVQDKTCKFFRPLSAITQVINVLNGIWRHHLLSNKVVFHLCKIFVQVLSLVSYMFSFFYLTPFVFLKDIPCLCLWFGQTPEENQRQRIVLCRIKWLSIIYEKMHWFFGIIYNIWTSFSHFYKRRSVLNGNDYLHLQRCLLPCAVKVTWYTYLPGYQNEYIGCSESVLVHECFH